MDVKPFYDDFKIKERQFFLFEEFYNFLVEFDDDLNTIDIKEVPKKLDDRFYTTFNNMKDVALQMKSQSAKIFEASENKLDSLQKD